MSSSAEMASGAGSEIELVTSICQESRDAIYRDVQGLTIEALDWPGPDPRGVVTIGSQLLHIAGYNSLVRAALSGASLTDLVGTQNWMQRYGDGFPRELSLDPPQGRTLEDYLEILRDEATLTAEMIANLGSYAIDLAGQSEFYTSDRLFDPAALAPHNNHRLLYSVPLHDQAHRGQIAQLRYFYTKLRPGTADEETR